MNIFPKQTLLLVAALGWLFAAACSKDNNNNQDNDPNTPGSGDNSVTALLEFSSGRTVNLKATSMLPGSIPDMLVSEDGGATWMWTSDYRMEEDGLKYLIGFKAKMKDETGSYGLYTRDEDYLETLGWYLEVQVESTDGSIEELYQSRAEGDESGTLTITHLTNDRMKGTFEADIPMSPVNGERLRITNGKFDLKMKRVHQ